MAYNSYIKKVPGFTFLGPMLIFAGMLSASDTGLIYALNPDMVFEPVSMDFAVIYFIATALFSFLLMHAGYLLYSGLVYSRYYACAVLYLCLTAVLCRVYLLGTGPHEWKIFFELACIIFALAYMNQPRFRIRFEYKRSVWGISIFFGWVIILMTGTYIYLRSSEGADKSPPINVINFDRTAATNNLSVLPLAYGIKIPNNFHLSSIENDSGNISITFHNPDYGYIIMNNYSGITPMYKRMRVLGYQNEYDFAMQFYKEKIGLVPMFLRRSMTSMNIGEYDIVQNGGLTLLLEKSTGDNTVAHVFRGEELLGEITLISISSNDTGLYNEIFSTIKYREPEHDAQKLYDIAASLLNKKKPEEAKLLFASASVINPDDAEYRYMLAETFAVTGYISSAKKQLESCLKLSGDHARAKKLMETLDKLQ